VSAKESKKKEELKEFTVGSVPPASNKGKKAPTGPKVEINEKNFPILAGLVKGNGIKAFKEEADRVLSGVQGDKDAAAVAKIQKAYGMAIQIVDNGKAVKE
jgi:hypothetical protein